MTYKGLHLRRWKALATVSGFQAQRVHRKVFELGPSLYVMELRKSHGDTALYIQLCDRISGDLGIHNIFRTEPLLGADHPSFDRRAATPLVAL